MNGIMGTRDRTCDKEYLVTGRRHNCGLCKIIALEYGQTMRMALSRDAVFLAELLSELSGDETDWPDSIKDHNCFRLPSREASRFPVLQTAAAACVFSAELHIRDNIHDDNSPFWRLIHWVFRGQFKKAGHNVAKTGLSSEKLNALALQQIVIEDSPSDNIDPKERLYEYSEPSALIFSAFFERAAFIAACAEWSDDVSRLGLELGRLVYIIDAYEDIAEDGRKVRFNAISRAFDGAASQNAASGFVMEFIEARKRNIIEILNRLPLSPEPRERFKKTLMESVENRLARINRGPLKIRDRFNTARENFLEQWRGLLTGKYPARSIRPNPIHLATGGVFLLMLFPLTLFAKEPSFIPDARDMRESCL